MLFTLEIDARPILREWFMRHGIFVAHEDDGSEWVSLDLLADRLMRGWDNGIEATALDAAPKEIDCAANS